VSRTCTFGRGFSLNAYHSSVRVQVVGSPAVVGSFGFFELQVGCLDRGVLAEVGADELAVKRPVVLGVTRGVDADEALAGADEALESCLLVVVEHVARRRKKDDHVEHLEARVREDRRGVGRGESPARARGDVRECGLAVRNRIVVVARGFGKDEHGERSARSAGGSRRARRARRRGCRGITAARDEHHGRDRDDRAREPHAA
jgi:hypothetical protein